jgi:hypothetical protein
MSQSELNDVVAAVESLVRRAYALGRRDALRQLVKYAQSDEAIAKPLALLAPVVEAQSYSDDDASKVTANDVGAPAIAGHDETAKVSRYGIPAAEPGQSSSGLTAMILDFVYPSKAS